MTAFESMINGKKVLVFGLGKQGGGVGDANWLADHSALVRVTDQQTDVDLESSALALHQNIERSFGGHKVADIEWADLIVKNPGVPDDHPHLLEAQKQGKSVFTSIALFVKYAHVTTIGVTGTRGKSTTTALINAILEQAFPGEIISGGNIPGTSGLALFDLEPAKKYAVLELSSFQLHNFHELKISPHIAVVTNLYPDHLNRYGDMDSYRHDKEAIVAYQKVNDFSLINSQNEGALAIGRASRGQVSTFSAQDVEEWETSLPGQHNRENIAAAWAVAKKLGIAEELVKKVIQDFHGLPFRQEVVKTVRGITYVNDTTATTPIATQKAIEAQTKPFTLICGGASKNLPFDALLDTLANNSLLEHIVILGSREIPAFVTALQKKLGSKIVAQVNSMDEAVIAASGVASPDSVVLLSPGFASFDLFENEFDRGRQFSQSVQKL